MANEMSNALKTAAEKIVSYVNNVSTMTVETRFVELNSGAADFSTAQPAACTVIRLDGDCSAVLPMRRTESGTLEVDTSLVEMHQRNVQTAIEYRQKMMQALLEAIKGQ